MADRPDWTREALDAMAAAGCAPGDPSVVVFDGRLHRYDVDGDRKGRKNGWFVLHDGLPPAGGFGSWKTGETRSWRGSETERLTPEQRGRERARIEAAQARRLEEQKRLHAQARARAAALWARAGAADAEHPYLRKKRVPAYGLRQLGPLLVVPVADEAGVLRSLQFIGAGGEKRFLTDGEVEGHAHLLGDPSGARALVLCEGYATGASLHKACGLPVAVCFNRVNLFPAAKNLRRRFPGAAPVLAADDDRYTAGNPGRRDAEETARRVGGAVILPDFEGLDTSSRPTDFNDVHLLGGLDHLRRQLEGKLAAALPPQAARESPPPRRDGPGGRDGDRELEPAARGASAASLALTDEPVLAMAAPATRGRARAVDAGPGAGSGRPSLYREVTDKIVALLEQGVAPWRPPWSRERPAGAPAGPFNAATGQPYRGVNVLLLASDPRTADDPRWCGFQQAKKQGWQVRAGERGTAVYFFKRVEPDGAEGVGDAGALDAGAPGERRPGFAVLRRHAVFHASQIEGIPSVEAACGPAEAGRPPWEIEGRLKALVGRTGALVLHGGGPGYLPESDFIRMPERARFPDQRSYFKSLFHELGHWTGHPSRLNRPLSTDRDTPAYAREELRAEMASAFLGAALGIPHDLGNHASYLEHYLGLLRHDDREIFRAARDAQAIADLILERHPTLQLQNGVCVARADPPFAPAPGAVSLTEKGAGEASEPEPGAATDPAGADGADTVEPRAEGSALRRDLDALLAPARQLAEAMARWRWTERVRSDGMFTADCWRGERDDMIRLAERIGELLAAVAEPDARERARRYAVGRWPDFGLTERERTYYADGSSEAMPEPVWFQPAPAVAERPAGAPPAQSGEPSEGTGDPALPAPYRWAWAALADPDAGFRDGPLDRPGRSDATPDHRASALAGVAPAERRPSAMPSHPHLGGLPP